TEFDRAWSPGPSPCARALSWVRPVRTRSWSLNLTSGASVEGRSYLSPVWDGVQNCMLAPLGKKTNAERRAPLGPVAAPTERELIASRNGSATPAPAPRKRVRRVTCEKLTP